MSTLTLRDAWVKAAVEHLTLKIRYHSARTKGQTTTREVEPDYYGYDVDGKNFGCWGFCRLRRANRVFVPDSVRGWEFIGNSYSPNPIGRWRELQHYYKEKKLNEVTW